MTTIELLTPQTIPNGGALRRVGSFKDGGYVVLDKIMTDSNILYTFGVGDEDSFEMDFIKKENAEAFLYDHTVDYKTWSRLADKLHFFKKALAPSRSKNGDTVTGHMNANHMGEGTKNFLVKIDVEGFELDYFAKPLESRIAYDAVGLIVEFHIFSKADVKKFVIAMEHICKFFVTYHVHANNYVQKFFELDGKQVPEVLEVSFANKFHFDIPDQSFHPTDKKYPIVGLDYPCIPIDSAGYPDHDLSALLF